ncbi:MAG: DNA topoisomerase (ATP-hydrolyzing) subunit A, partial [Eubacteriales bacterium]
MPKKKTEDRKASGISAEITPQIITDTIEKNFMPYAMSVIVSRAIPEIDGFKPSHRKLLYTMYKMGLLTGTKTKSANVVGQTMHLNPHGGDAIYATLVRLTRGNETLLHPFIDSKGSFGKHYSSDMAYAAQRYTECKLDSFCAEIFRGINADAVDFIPNYDNTTTEPVLLPVAFPNILVTPSLGIAVGMTSKICSFNLAEICDGAVQLLRNDSTTVEQLLDIIKAPDFSGGGDLIYNRSQLLDIYKTGRGGIKLRAKYVYDAKANCIDIIQIPYSTTIELILKRITDLVKDGKFKEITDFRDEIDLSGFKLTLDLRRGVDPDKLMLKLFRQTPLEDSFDCNFNVLIDGAPQQLGIRDLLCEWIKFRVKTVRRELSFELERKRDKLHLLLGLGKILLDIDRAVKIVRETKLEKDVVANLMSGFGIDQIQADYIAEIKLRNLNREYILNRIKEIEELQNEIAELESKISSEEKLKAHIVSQLKEIKKKYARPRQTNIVFEEDIETYTEDEPEDDIRVRVMLTNEGYFKKITLQSLRGNDEHKLKEEDFVSIDVEASNSDELLFVSDKAQIYKAKVSDFDTVKASELGDYIPTKLAFDDGERVITMKVVKTYKESENVVYIFENGKGVRVPITSYETKTNRRKLTAAYSDASKPVGVFFEEKPFDILLITNAGRVALINSSLISVKST